MCNIYHSHTSTVWWCLFIFKRIYKIYPPARQLPWFFWSVGGIFHSSPTGHTQMNLSKIEWEVFYVENMAADFQPDVVVWFAVCRFPNAGVWFQNDSRSIAATEKTRVQFAVEGNEFAMQVWMAIGSVGNVAWSSQILKMENWPQFYQWG